MVFALQAGQLNMTFESNQYIKWQSHQQEDLHLLQKSFCSGVVGIQNKSTKAAQSLSV